MFEKCYIYIYTHNLVKSLFSMKIVQNSRTFCHVYNNDDTSKSWEFKADTRYFYSNWIKQVFNKIYASESTALLKSIKSQSWLPAFYAKPGSRLLELSQLRKNMKNTTSLARFWLMWIFFLGSHFFQSCFIDLQ